MYYCLTELCVCLGRAQEAHGQENQSMFQGYLWVKLYYIVDMELETQRPGTTTTLKSTAQVSVCGVTKKQDVRTDPQAHCLMIKFTFSYY